jgi:hypothetical protein
MHFTTPRIVAVDAATAALCVGAARGATCGCDIRCRICPDSDVAREITACWRRRRKGCLFAFEHFNQICIVFTRFLLQKLLLLIDFPIVNCRFDYCWHFAKNIYTIN